MPQAKQRLSEFVRFDPCELEYIPEGDWRRVAGAAREADQQKGNPHAILDAYIRISQQFRSVATKLEKTFEPLEQTREPTFGLL